MDCDDLIESILTVNSVNIKKMLFLLSNFLKKNDD